MSASIITFANLGKKTNLPTADILPAIRVLADHADLHQVICQINTGFYFPNTESAVPAIVRYPLRIFERISGISIPRAFIERLFDFFAARKLEPAQVCFLHGVLPETLRAARRNGAITVEVARTAHVGKNAALEKEEMALLGLGDYQTLYFTRRFEASENEETARYVIAMSDFVKESYIEAGFPGDRIFVAAPDIDTARFSPSFGSAEEKSIFRVLYVAYSQPLKGLHYLLDAWNELRLSDAELVIVGDFSILPPALRKRYEDTISRNPNIICERNMLTPEHCYKKASVFVLPSLTEGFGRVTLEAMASGLPVITTENAQGIVEDGKTGFVVPIRDAAALKEKIRYLYDHRDVAARMGRDARAAVEQKKPFGEAVYEIYRNILEREHPGVGMIN